MRPDAEFRQSDWVLALRDLGWIEGKNVVFERRASDGKSELLPRLARELVNANVGVLANARDPEQQAKYESRMLAAARALSVEVQFFWYKSQGDVEVAFPVMAGKRIQTFVLEPYFFTFRNRDRIAELALQHRLPGVFTLREYAVAGGLMSYGPDYPTLERQHARYIDRILRGANPGDLAIEQPAKFHLAVNLKSAKALGIAVPQSILLRADEEIR
jgi:putative ABC transport system substrate-binding protein